MKLSQDQVDLLIATPGYHADGNRLYLHVRESGSWTWFLQFRLDNKERGTGLGRCSLLEAREIAEDVRRASQLGIDVVANNKERLQSKEFRSVAKARRLKQGRDYKERNKESVYAQMKVHRNLPHIVASNRETAKANWEKNKTSLRLENNARTKKYAASLHDWYIKRLLAPQLGLQQQAIAQEWIELKRQSISIHRMARVVKKQVQLQKD